MNTTLGNISSRTLQVAEHTSSIPFVGTLPVQAQWSSDTEVLDIVPATINTMLEYRSFSLIPKKYGIHMFSLMMHDTVVWDDYLIVPAPGV